MRAFLLSALAAAALAAAAPVALAQEPDADPPAELLPGLEGLPPLTPPQSVEPLAPLPLPALPDAPPAGPALDGAAEAALSPAQRLDKLFADLKRQSNAQAAGRIAARIDAEWATSGSDTVDLLVQWAGEAMAKDDKAAALDVLGEAIAMRPDYAEAWNRRATLHYLAEDYGKSIYDIERTLALEPRHYGALMGLGAILESIERKPEALDAYTRALAVYPALKGAQDAVGRLSEELSGRAI